MTTVSTASATTSHGNLTSYSTPDVIAQIQYDAANRKTAETVTIGTVTKTYSYSYDTSTPLSTGSRGNKTSFTSPEGITYSYTYNKNDQPKTISTPAGQISLDYSWVRNSKVTLPNGVIADYSYNKNSWLTGIAALKAPNSVYSANYQFDKVGNITSKASDASTPLSTGTTTAYGYDKTYQLLNSTNTLNSENFTYDKVGNRKTKQGTQAPWTYNKNNELLAAEVATYGYDANGNTVTKMEGGASTTFGYSATDRLTSVLLPDGRTASYTYDPFGRRIKKQVAAETTLYIYADEGLIGEYTQAGTASKTYGWRPNGIWGTNPVLMTEGANYYFYHNDHLGTPQTMTDSAGDIVWEATYEVFGKAVVDVDSTVVNNLRFPGQYWDEETGLHYNWHRYYDPGTGRYIKVDPIGFDAEDVNLFRYAENNPQVNIDPQGLWVKRCSRKLGNMNKPATSKYNPLRHDYFNVSGTFVGFKAGTNSIPGTGTLWSQGWVDIGINSEFDGGRCHTLICGDKKFDKYVLEAAKYKPTYCVLANPDTIQHAVGARNCQTWANEVIERAKVEYLRKEKCPGCFK